MIFASEMEWINLNDTNSVIREDILPSARSLYKPFTVILVICDGLRSIVRCIVHSPVHEVRLDGVVGENIWLEYTRSVVGLVLLDNLNCAATTSRAERSL